MYGKYECFVMQMLYVCVLCAFCGSSQCCMTCSLLMQVEEAYSRAGLMTALYPMNVSSCLPHPVGVSAFIIGSGLCACTEMLWLCVSFGSKVSPRIFGCVAMGSAVLFILRCKLFCLDFV